MRKPPAARSTHKSCAAPGARHEQRCEHDDDGEQLPTAVRAAVARKR